MDPQMMLWIDPALPERERRSILKEFDVLDDPSRKGLERRPHDLPCWFHRVRADEKRLPEMATRKGAALFVDYPITLLGHVRRRPYHVLHLKKPYASHHHARDRLWRAGGEGAGVWMVFVDGGINATQLRAEGLEALSFDPKDPWHFSYPQSSAPGAAAPDGHGTAMAWTAAQVAPRARVIDVPVIQPGQAYAMQARVAPWLPNGGAFLSTVVCAYQHLLARVKALRAHEAATGAPPQPIVVCNCWQVTNTADHPPMPDPRNYVHNPDHYVHRLIQALAAQHVDIVFAAGNCGGRNGTYSVEACTVKEPDTVYGASGHEDVLSVGAVSLDDLVAGYSAAGPGPWQAAAPKPDVCCYAHFSAPILPEGLHAGTSTAAALATGVVAAVRSRYGPRDVPPAVLRRLLRETARPIPGLQASSGTYHPQGGHGVLDVDALYAALAAEAGGSLRVEGRRSMGMA